MKYYCILCFVLLLCNSVCAVSLDELYDVKPNPSGCSEGALKNSEKQKVLNRLNVIRKLHDIKPVSYKSGDDVLTAKSALIMQSNATLTHNPDKTMKCWSAEGEKGSGKSNIHIYYSSGMKDLEESVDILSGWLIDDGVESLGHRRWLIDPFLKHVSFGRVDGKPVVNTNWDTTTGASISVIHDESADIKDTKTEFVAYPYKNYSNALFNKNWYLSFTALYDRKSAWNNSDAKYANAKIDVTDENGKALSAHSVSHDNTGFGVPNIIQWKVNGLQDNVKYAVKISNVMVQGKPREYAYWFKLSGETPEKLAAIDSAETTIETPTETSTKSKTESKPEDCASWFIQDSVINWKTFSKEALLKDGTFNITKTNKDYFEVLITEDDNTDPSPLYGSLMKKQFALIHPAFQDVWKGTCMTDGAYGITKDSYFYAGPRADVTPQDIQNVLQQK